MTYQHIGRLPRTLDRRGARILSDQSLVNEAAAILRGVMNSAGRRYRTLGFKAPYAWLVQHLDDDHDLTRKVLVAAGFRCDREAGWISGRGFKKLGEITDLDVLGDMLVGVVDTHRPV